jgi:hypothetical protein
VDGALGFYLNGCVLDAKQGMQFALDVHEEGVIQKFLS